MLTCMSYRTLQRLTKDRVFVGLNYKDFDCDHSSQASVVMITLSKNMITVIVTEIVLQLLNNSDCKYIVKI